MMESQTDNPIEFSTLEKQIMTALLQAKREPTPACLDPEAMLDLVEQGDKHPRYAALCGHLAACTLCRDEYALLNQTWREARNLPTESPVTPHSVWPEALEPPVTSSNRPTLGKWLRGLVLGGTGARIAWGATSLILLLAGWTAWQVRQTRTVPHSAQTQLQAARNQIAALSEQLNQARQAQKTNETKLADAQAKTQQLQTRLATTRDASHQAVQEAQRKVETVNAQILDLKQQISLARNDAGTSRLLLASIAGLRSDQETVRGNSDVRLRSPLATCVLEERPRFQWTLDNPVLTVTSYEITIDGDYGYHHVKHLTKDADEWDMAMEPNASFPPLKRGAVYHWKICAFVTGSAPVVSSTAKFKIASQETVNQIGLARRNDAEHPLLLFKTYLQNGLLDNARREVNAMFDSLQRPTSRH